MNTIFISSTYQDLADYRKAVADVLFRMKHHFSAMEFFGSRTNEAVNVCKQEIEECAILIGIYAWRYGWIPPGSTTSVTEQEFDHAQQAQKPCLCYIADDKQPWPPSYIETGENAEKLNQFKAKLSQLVRATFTTPDNLAMQVAADVARELSQPCAVNTVGGILQLNWDRLAPDLQLVILDAFKRSLEASSGGVVSTRHVIAAMESLPNSSSVLFRILPKDLVDEVRADSDPARFTDDSAALSRVFTYGKPFSNCVLGSLQRLLPSHSSQQRLLAIEVAADLLKNGRNKSVEKFRRANIDAIAVERLVRHAKHISSDLELIRNALDTFDDSTVALLGYEIGLVCDPGLTEISLRDRLVQDARNAKKLTTLAGELMRRNPNLLN